MQIRIIKEGFSNKKQKVVKMARKLKRTKRPARNSRSGRRSKHHYLWWALGFIGALTLLNAGSYLWFIGGINWPAKVEEPPAEWTEDFRPESGDPPYKIVVDAGHGGSDPGATGVIVEREMTAATAEALVQLLEADPNFIPLGTRDSYDTTATPTERVEQANQQKPDLLLSIHGNSSTGGSDASGFECYPVTPGRTWHRESLYFAKKLAAEMEAEGNPLRGQGGIRYIYYNEEDQKILAEANNTQVREETTFTILEEAECPAVLAEQCFVTNPEDVDQFGDADGVQRAARVYYRAICAYFETEPLE